MIRRTLAVLGVAVLAAPALADWIPGDGHKMHFPQLPDPTGWDVMATNGPAGPAILADDWQCSDSGPVSDIHFWGSWAQGLEGQITNVRLSIHSNIPADPVIPYSRPGELLWAWDTDDLGIVPVDPPSQQGWLDPVAGVAVPNDHSAYFQYNIENIPMPFEQVQGTIYWLDISVNVADPIGTQWGWKTSQDHFMDDAVYWHNASQAWQELRDPFTQESLDMAFVITPAPGALGLLGVAGLLAGRRRRQP